MTPDLFRKLAALGLSHDQMAGVLEIIDADAVARKEKARARVQKWRSKNEETSRNVTKRSVTEGNVSSGLVTRAEDKSSNKQISEKEEKEDTAPAALSDLQAFKVELSELDGERVEALIKHRRAKKAQLTAHAARLFKADAAKAGISLSEAVDTCISRNWITVKADWLQGSQRQSTAPPKAKTVGDMFREDARRMGLIHDQATSTTPERLGTSDRNGKDGSSGIARRFALPSNVLGDVGQG